MRESGWAGFGVSRLTWGSGSDVRKRRERLCVREKGIREEELSLLRC